MHGGVSYVEGDLLEGGADVVVNAVNCVGVAGKGLALQMRTRYPEATARYAKICALAALQPGLVVALDTAGNGEWWSDGTGNGISWDGRTRLMACVPTKRHWRDASRPGDVVSGAEALAVLCRRLAAGARRAIEVAVPPLGCGLGGLGWDQVGGRIVAALEAVPEVRWQMYAPAPRARGAA